MKEEPIGRKINVLARIFNDSIREKVNEENLGTTTFNLLRILIKNEIDGKILTQKDLCTITSMKAPTISLTLQDMEQVGYIKKEKSSEDGRVTYVKLTPKGREKCEDIKELFISVDKRIESCLDEDELANFNYLMDKIIFNMKGDRK